jgi:ribonuclease HI
MSDTESDTPIEHSDDEEMKHEIQPTQVFYEDIPEEVRQLYELKYTVGIASRLNEAQQNASWSCVVVNNKNKKVCMQGEIGIDASSSFLACKQRGELQALIEALQSIYSDSNPHKEFTNVTIYTDSVYMTNIVREWIHKWQHQLQSRPHAILLQQLWSYLSVYHKNIEILWVSCDSSPLLQECMSKV